MVSMDLNYLLSRKDINTRQSKVLVMRHVPQTTGLRRALPWLAADYPKTFNAYQRAQAQAKAGKQLTRAEYLASFIGHKAKEALFVGVYRVAANRLISYLDYWQIPENTELRKLGMTWLDQEDDFPSELWFDLELTDIYSDWKGKLIVTWPGPEIAWARWADQNEFVVKAILDESILVKQMPEWNNFLLTWDELNHLPNSWVHAMRQWRGVYFILDGTDGKGYVGSACGEQNLYGRWKNYAESGDGGNKLLRERAPDKFRFSILQLVSPSDTKGDVTQLENNWKDRLHTREFGLNAN